MQSSNIVRLTNTPIEEEPYGNMIDKVDERDFPTSSIQACLNIH